MAAISTCFVWATDRAQKTNKTPVDDGGDVEYVHSEPLQIRSAGNAVAAAFSFLTGKNVLVGPLYVQVQAQQEGGFEIQLFGLSDQESRDLAACADAQHRVATAQITKKGITAHVDRRSGRRDGSCEAQTVTAIVYLGAAGYIPGSFWVHRAKDDDGKVWIHVVRFPVVLGGYTSVRVTGETLEVYPGA
jgi:hypothetical protein